MSLKIIQSSKESNSIKKNNAISSSQSLIWKLDEVINLFNLPFNDLLFRAQKVHRKYFDANEIELAVLLSIKTGGCTEDCGYCPQSTHYNTEITATKILSIESVITAAQKAKSDGATRFCMGAAWRELKDRDLDNIENMICEVKKIGLETCLTLGMLNENQAYRLKKVGLDYYNHNLDTSPKLYGDIISTRDYENKLNTLKNVRNVGINICCGGIIGLSESRDQRAELIFQLANLNPYPESVPINNLVQIKGTPLYGSSILDPLEFIRTIAVARITMPTSRIRMSAGRKEMGETTQAFCFLAGANSIFYGDKLLTTDNTKTNDDSKLLKKLGINTRNIKIKMKNNIKQI
ncbi:biotin synthase BioB [Candidatus Profftella armatura]|uniref:biotin synthase BioB n=1 Tax=Candidatus Profftella armatura TaxID=669502 RepID=UPI003D9797A6